MKSTWSLVLGAAGAVNAQYFAPFPDCVNGLLASNKVCDATLSPPARAAALVAALTIDEKLQNIIRCVTRSTVFTCVHDQS